MRSSMRPIGPAIVIAFLSLASVTAAIAEDAEFEGGSSDGSQIQPAGAEAYVPKEKNLNSVPESSASVESRPVTDSPFVRQILAARPNEDLVICIAGCFTSRDRVIYAQPSSKLVHSSMIDAPQVNGALKPSRAAEADTGASNGRPAVR